MTLDAELRGMLEQFHRRYPKGVYAFDGGKIDAEARERGFKRAIICRVISDPAYPRMNELARYGLKTTAEDVHELEATCLRNCLQQIGIYPDVVETIDPQVTAYREAEGAIRAIRFRRPSLIDRLFGEREPRYTAAEWRALEAAERELADLGIPVGT